jgi:hypothetical protein
MLELADRRQRILDGLLPEMQETAEFLRETLLTHIELIKRKEESEQLKSAAGPTSLSFQHPNASAPPQQPQQQSQMQPSSNSQKASEGLQSMNMNSQEDSLASRR